MSREKVQIYIHCFLQGSDERLLSEVENSPMLRAEQSVSRLTSVCSSTICSSTQEKADESRTVNIECISFLMQIQFQNTA